MTVAASAATFYGNIPEDARNRVKDMSDKSILEYETVELLDDENAIRIIDQTLLPGRQELILLRTAEEIWDAIYLLKVRGAPAIGVCAAFGIYLLSKQTETEDYEFFVSEFEKQKAYLDSSRPTAVNLSWALRRMEGVLLEMQKKGASVQEAKQALLKEAVRIKEEDIEVCRRIGEFGLTLVKPATGSSRTATQGSSRHANTVLQRRRSIWDRREATVSTSMQMRRDRFCRGQG